MKGKNRSNGNGAILMTTIIVLAFLSVLGMSLIAFLRSHSSYSQMQIDRLKAFSLAEAGLAKSIWELRYDLDPDGNGPGNIDRLKLGEGWLWADHDFQTATITSTGEVEGSKRTIQIKYSAV